MKTKYLRRIRKSISYGFSPDGTMNVYYKGEMKQYDQVFKFMYDWYLETLPKYKFDNWTAKKILVNDQRIYKLALKYMKGFKK